MSARRSRLGDAVKAAPAPVAAPLPEEKEAPTGKAPVGAKGRIAMSVYLSPEAYEQMKQLGIIKRAKASELLREGLNKVFVENGLPPVA